MPANIEAILIPILVMLTVVGIAYALFSPFLDGEKEQEKRRKTVVNAAAMRTNTAKGKPTDRRKNIADTLKELEEQQKKRKKVPLKRKLKQAGIGLSPTAFILVMSAVAGCFAFFSFVTLNNPFIAACVFITTIIAQSKFILNFLVNRRKNKFLVELPNAIDVVSRGIKSGLPLADCFKVIAMEAKEPLRSEFKEVVDAQMIGQTLGESLERMYDRVPLPEVNFLAIVINIQQSSGGNLAEALTNLSKVIRERKKMRDKINAVSQEAKSSAAIIGALPVVVSFGLYFISPDYMGLLFETKLGNIMLYGCGIWMSMGVMIMAKMINFKI